MQRIVPMMVALTLTAAAASAQQQQTPQPQPPPPRMAASSYATEEVHLDRRRIGGRWYEEDASLSGPSRIAIAYGQPHARGRTVEGGLIPRDTVWRFGANMATTLHTDVDITLGGLRLPHGDYSLFVLYAPAGWQLVINRDTGQWGTDYDAAKDVGRVALTSRTLAEPEESLSIYLVPSSARPQTGYAVPGGVLRFKWGRTELSTNWTIDP